mmetsp:Transcript_120079/g.350950  ORF Transcript_120079/g.350950 Transcript_120079/m.350950 type:complete len:248 (+) Transcript_120079:1887-2630(+)
MWAASPLFSWDVSSCRSTALRMALAMAGCSRSISAHWTSLQQSSSPSSRATACSLVGLSRTASRFSSAPLPQIATGGCQVPPAKVGMLVNMPTLPECTRKSVGLSWFALHTTVEKAFIFSRLQYCQGQPRRSMSSLRMSSKGSTAIRSLSTSCARPNIGCSCSHCSWRFARYCLMSTSTACFASARLAKSWLSLEMVPQFFSWTTVPVAMPLHRIRTRISLAALASLPKALDAEESRPSSWEQSKMR